MLRFEYVKDAIIMNIFGARKDRVVAEEELVSLVSGRRGDAGAFQQHETPTAVHLTLSIKGMHCSACSTAVESALK